MSGFVKNKTACFKISAPCSVLAWWLPEVAKMSPRKCRLMMTLWPPPPPAPAASGSGNSTKIRNIVAGNFLRIFKLFIETFIKTLARFFHCMVVRPISLTDSTMIQQNLFQTCFFNLPRQKIGVSVIKKMIRKQMMSTKIENVVAQVDVDVNDDDDDKF